MRLTLDADGLWDFFERAGAEPWAAPWIRSQDWVDRLPAESVHWIALEQGKRELGRELARRLDTVSLEQIGPASTRKREEWCERLLDAANWLKQSRGYGNLLLTTRMENLAYVQIGHLVADLDYDVGTVEGFVRRVATHEEQLSFRLAVLREEAPDGVDVPRREDLEHADWSPSERLERWWMRGARELREGCGPRWPRSQAELANCALPEAVAFFFFDEPARGARTIATTWDHKLHLPFCVHGNGTAAIRRSIDSLLLYRQKIGHFPTVPVEQPPPGLFLSPVQAAFSEAWEEYRHEHGPIGTSAARALEAAQANRLMDHETRSLLQEKEP